MTIGAYDRDPSTENPDFVALVECKKQLCAELGLEWNSVELSMGMSSDYEQAVRSGINIFEIQLILPISDRAWKY